jgi:DNA repair exonuclease SbcCD ATPase subunit
MKITQEQYDSLTAEQKKLWKKDGDGYSLIGDTEIAAEMRRAKEREQQKAQELSEELQKLKDKLAELEGNNARRTGDIEAIEKSWDGKLKTQKKEYEDKIKKLTQQVEKLLIDDTVTKLATEIFTKPGRDQRLIRERLKVEYDGDTPVVRVLDKDGKPTALTLDDLKKETCENPDYEDILIGSKASGSGGAAGNKGGGAAKQPKDMTEAERIELLRTNPARFRELFPN